jgi:hypothetical protein
MSGLVALGRAYTTNILKKKIDRSFFFATFDPSTTNNATNTHDHEQHEAHPRTLDGKFI